MKLVLGTVQLGLDYGISNQYGQVKSNEAKEIIHTANNLNINYFDTAAAYGNAEKVLGKYLTHPANVITKLPPDVTDKTNLFNCLNDSLENLGLDNIYAVMLHDANQLIKYPKLLDQLIALKNSGKITKIGASFYFPEQLAQCEKFNLDIIQVPANILDQRFIRPALLKRLKSQGIEIHVRSAFLQGLLLMKTKELSHYFKNFKVLKALEQSLLELNITKLSACLGFLKSIKEIDALVVGCCNSLELKEIVNTFNHATDFNANAFKCEDLKLIYPANWPVRN